MEKNFDFQMDNSGEFIRGFYHWSNNSHNWGKQIDVNVYLVVSYATDSNMVRVSLISGKDELACEWIIGRDFDEVMQACKKITDNYYEYFCN